MLKGAAIDAIVIGASAGGIDVLSTILPAIPRAGRVPVIVVMHLPPRAPSLLAEIFASKCAFGVREPIDKEPIAPATVFFAPPDYHLLIERDGTFALSVDPPVNYSRPSIDVLFESAADAYGARVFALVLTGASSDGARGAKSIRDAGGFVAVQSPATAEAAFLPQAAIDAGAADVIEAPSALADRVRALYAEAAS